MVWPEIFQVRRDSWGCEPMILAPMWAILASISKIAEHCPTLEYSTNTRTVLLVVQGLGYSGINARFVKSKTLTKTTNDIE